MESDATLRGMPLQWPGTEGHATSTVPSVTGPDVPIGCPGAPPAHLSICAHSRGATGSLARQEEGLDPGPKTQPRPLPLALPCFLPCLQGASGQSDMSASSTQNEPQTLACPPSCASSNDTCSAQPKHHRLDVRQLYPLTSHIPSFDLFPIKSCQLS
jgi:hypothetical protein